MTSEQQLQASDEIVEKVQAGTLLKNKRESLGLSQKQIADRLRLRVSIIENIESNNFTSDQVATFTRGYLRSYARAVGIAESEVLCALDGCEETQPEEQEMKSFSHKTKREAHDSRIMTLTLGIVIVVLGISSVWWWQNQEKSMESLTDQTDQEIQLEQATENQPLDFTTLTEAELEPAVGEDAIQALDSTAAPVTEEVVSSEPVTTEIVEETQPVQAVPVSETKDVVKPEPVEETATTEQPAVANLLVMSFSDDCWIQVKDASGKTLSTGVKKAGQSLNLSGNLPYSVILGAPENVSMTLASEPVDLSGYTSGKVARFNLP
ncbi:cytoskeleton protein RodZ [Vibrio europaeus]|uniref:Cytoskeleton protein RodZ n=1 Tax=Vibrio europaeus TaxID=300876 RepID=A0A178JDU6_9VIBR|nr:cytoskeleton protein RodZ [Vibrio europaeus]MDC5703408.1 cytoskeleton protein RodZ [Vibrio europaeus]MDC5711437.1 cytoskeleton protein RodZ [Vibrio europaeus]MDC5714930.1 cytoskeleton protein RodZ [Vibrio europaeus]MDC5722132.1 cytoskeleton protein RodZ [Vibrio europaeus]MDC5727548.1 cytoskeleton protein RodZ [Vibrio europaeus]